MTKMVKNCLIKVDSVDLVVKKNSLKISDKLGDLLQNNWVAKCSYGQNTCSYGQKPKNSHTSIKNGEKNLKKM